MRLDPAVLCDLPANRRYLIGVSGGRDSVALLHWLVAQGYRKLVVCHLDHKLRGRSSTADARFVAKLAARLGLGCEVAEANVRSLAKTTKCSIETAARAARYSFFAAVARRRRCRTIFLGHHADDLVETFLINLFRGAGSTGQRGIQAVAERNVDGLQLTIVRPLLDVWRTEIDVWLRENRIRFRDDESNASDAALRNRIRHRVLPALEQEFGRDVRKAVRRASAIAADEDALLSALVPPELATSDRLKVTELTALPVALQRRALTRWLRHHEVADVGFEMIENVRGLLDLTNGPAKVNLTEDRHARRRSGVLFIEP